MAMTAAAVSIMLHYLTACLKEIREGGGDRALNKSAGEKQHRGMSLGDNTKEPKGETEKTMYSEFETGSLHMD